MLARVQREDTTAVGCCARRQEREAGDGSVGRGPLAGGGGGCGWRLGLGATHGGEAGSWPRGVVAWQVGRQAGARWVERLGARAS